MSIICKRMFLVDVCGLFGPLVVSTCQSIPRWVTSFRIFLSPALVFATTILMCFYEKFCDGAGLINR